MGSVSLRRQSKWHLLATAVGVFVLSMGFQNCGPTMSSDPNEEPAAQTTKRDPSTISGPGGGSGGGYYNGGSGSTGGTGTVGEGSPGSGTPGSGAPGTGAPGTGTPGAGTPGAGTPGAGTPGAGTPGAGTPGTPGTPGVLYFMFQPRDVLAEEGQTAYLTGFATNGTSTDIRYQWYKDGQILSGLTSSTLEIRNAGASNAGAFYVTATDGKTTVTSSTVRLKVQPARNACPAGWYGRIPNVTPETELVHATSPNLLAILGRFQITTETNDAYMVVVDCATYQGPYGYQGHWHLQCRNGKFSMVQNNCIVPVDDDGGD